MVLEVLVRFDVYERRQSANVKACRKRQPPEGGIVPCASNRLHLAALIPHHHNRFDEAYTTDSCLCPKKRRELID
jgi:hypothetical protein